MKSSLGVVLAAVIVVALLAFEYWQYRDAQAYREALNTQLIHISERVNTLDQRVQLTKAEIDKLQQSSLGGLIETANDALIQGWSAMINSVEKELERAKQGIAAQPQTKQSNGSSSVDPAPNNGAGTR
ncbi:hypothetical protein [Zhongshania marina]|jgi:chromosome segregation ATPase|uniref:Uncharacterized protein n=1 Tax=Zhongshania marina TaxID=2304603 RepID=A0ABX9WAF6_9GAMM|nr:hypothetical protein D0911_00945 [Zhongshania marina]